MAILFKSTPAAIARWRPFLAKAWPDRDLRFWPEIGDAAAIDYALVWHPEPGMLVSLPNLKLIVSLGAGVDHILRDPELPACVPIMRLVDPYMTQAMSEYVALQVLRLHRQDFAYRAQQAAAEWREHDQKNAAERTVGILGFGTLGQDAAVKLKGLGFDVAGWSRSGRAAPGFVTYGGEAGLDALLRRSEILVTLLPMTPETENILDAGLFGRLPHGAGLVNVGRGRQMVDADLLAALELRADFRRRARCLSRRAAAAGAPVLASPAYHCHAACRGRDAPADRDGDHRAGDRRFRGRATARQCDRSRQRVLTGSIF